MQFSISDSMISEFFSGLFVIFGLIGVGAAIMLVLSALGRKFPFSRLALALALTPISMIHFIDRGAVSTLFLYSMIVTLLGITIDGIGYLLTSHPQPKQVNDKPEEKVQAPTLVEETPDPGMIVWEKAE